MAPLVRWTDSLDGLGLSTPINVILADRNRQLAERRRAVAAETTDLFDMARRQALMRWRGLSTDSHAS